MNSTKIKYSPPPFVLRTLIISLIALLFTSSLLAQTGDTSEDEDKSILEIFNEKLPLGAKWKGNDEIVRTTGPVDSTTNYIYVPSSNSPAELTGLSIPIRENPGPDEYRYITFSWIKWGNDLQIGMQFDYAGVENAANRPGEKYNYTYRAGKGDASPQGLIISGNGPGNWTSITRDLWKDFGDFTLKGVSFICPAPRDAGFDAIYLGKSENSFEGRPQVLPTEVAEPVDLENQGDMVLSNDSSETEQEAGVDVDWAAQIKAGGWMMYPLYLMGLAAIIIGLQRFMTAREVRLAPLALRTAIRDNLDKGDIKGALVACDEHPSTLAESLRFILKHHSAGMEVVSQTAGDIAARDIREHLNRIYPLSVIASLSPLLGLLGTIVGMIEAFALVAMYGDEGGAAILSDAISKALITTAAGLIIAAPSVAVYFMLKKRIMRLASIIEVEIENAITLIYLDDESSIVKASKRQKEDNHENII